MCLSIHPSICRPFAYVPFEFGSCLCGSSHPLLYYLCPQVRQAQASSPHSAAAKGKGSEGNRRGAREVQGIRSEDPRAGRQEASAKGAATDAEGKGGEREEGESWRRRVNKHTAHSRVDQNPTFFLFEIGRTRLSANDSASR